MYQKLSHHDRLRSSTALSISGLEGPIVVADDDRVRSPDYVKALAAAYRATRLSRRKFIDWAHDQLVDPRLVFVWPNRKPYVLSETPIDDVMGDDPGSRWLSELAQRTERPSTRRAQRRLTERYRRIGLALRVGGFMPETPTSQ